jgi:hypothetical protein
VKAAAFAEARVALEEKMTGCDKNISAYTDAKTQVIYDEELKKLIANSDALVEENNTQIKTLEEEQRSLIAQSFASVNISIAADCCIPAPCPPPKPDPVNPDEGEDISDYWTTISVEVDGSYDHVEEHESQTAVSGGAAASWGCLSGAASASAYTESAARCLAQLSKASIKVKFECMRVDIHRSWLRGELFYDDDLTVTPGNFISPGPVNLASLIDPDNYRDGPCLPLTERQKELAKYSLFPMYPTGKSAYV